MQLFKQIETLFRTGTAGGLTDSQLLERFVQQRDDAAFAALVDRHGAMVLRVCRQVLGDEHDAQDASQATFLVLARRAGSIGRRESVGCWLHGVALRVAAKARVAAARRRAHERRGAALAAGRLVEKAPTTPEDRERWTSLHEELGRLPETFRAPIVLCYLEGLTQEQAAAQLNAPLGTIQSRLARGRARLKARLEQRGVDASAATPGGAALAAAPPSPAPAAWVEATIRIALPFAYRTTTRTTAGLAGALAEEVLRTMLMGKIKVVVGMILFAAVLVTGVVTWAGQEAKKASDSHVAVIQAAQPVANPPQAALRPQPESEGWATRTAVRGIVRDEQGRPLAKVWIGGRVEPMPDIWTYGSVLDDIREAREPYRESKGNVIPPGPLGKYFEYRDNSGKWQSVHPDDIQAGDQDLPDTILRVRVAKGRWRMSPLFFSGEERVAARTDLQGHFAVEVRFFLPVFRETEIHFASPDFLREAVQVVRAHGADRLVEITLRPTRLIRARVIETPKDHPDMPLSWRVYSADPHEGIADHSNAIRGMGPLWALDPFDSPERPDSPGSPRRFEVRLPTGRYKAVFGTSSLARIVEIFVPEGEGPLDLPDIHLESSAWVKMLGKPAAGIEATDLDGKPVNLADYRGKVVLVIFWKSTPDDQRALPTIDRLAEVLKPIKDQPLAILVIRDASVNSVETFKQATAPLFDQQFNQTKVSCRLLLDRPPIGTGTGPYGRRAGEPGSGQTSDRYEVVGPATFVIDRRGRLAYALMVEFEGVAILKTGKGSEMVREFEGFPDGYSDDQNLANEHASNVFLTALEDQLGLPRTPRPQPAKLLRPPSPDELMRGSPPSRDPVIITGIVVGPDGKPVAGTRITPLSGNIPESEAKIEPSGAFSFRVDPRAPGVIVKVEAPGMATRTFFAHFRAARGPLEVLTIDPSGRITRPLQMSPGALITGRVVRGGKPVPGITMVLKHHGSKRDLDLSRRDQLLEDIGTQSDDQGHFQIPHVAAGKDLIYSIHAWPGSLEDDQTVIPRKFNPGLDGETIELGDFQVRRGRAVAGRVIFSDGKAPYRGARLYVSPENSEELSSSLDVAGRFAVKGIPDGSVSVSVLFTNEEGNPSKTLAGYRLSPRNKCLDPTQPDHLQGMLEHDVTDLTILFELGKMPDPVRLSGIKVDPALVADFNDAKSGPITGVPPGDLPKSP